ncbi:ribulose-phosphate 3-epimerase [Mycoplasmopsis hyopharyngis]|uniref:ribulose-phosphate 3-epimerase n=1 Tax=Mycoplasmopsis hyopharyngis TaxID=29558 RepID=UPI003873197E
MKKEKFITPSLLNVEKEKRLQMINHLVDNGIKWFHYDVMDGKFVPNLAIELDEIKDFRQNAKQHFSDTHLMIEEPLKVIDDYKDSTDIITLHYEAIKPKELLAFLKEKHHEYKIGLAIKPNTKVEEIKSFLPYLALVLVMSVEPGKGGQQFIPSALDKIALLKQWRIENAYTYLIQVDGGINSETGKQAFKAGVDACVAGTYLVKEPTKERINSMLPTLYKIH